MTDRELIIAVRGGNEAAKLELWNKSQKIISFVRRKVKQVEREDFDQEAYLVFERALAYVKIEKINDNFRFPALFYNFVQNLARRIRREQSHEFTYANEDPVEVFNGRPSSDLPVHSSVDPRTVVQQYLFDSYNVERFVQQEEFHTNMERLYQALTPLQRKIVHLRENGEELKDIAEDLGLTYGKTYFQLRKAKEVATKIFAYA